MESTEDFGGTRTDDEPIAAHLPLPPLLARRPERLAEYLLE
jgi:hypothetical protein